MPTRAEPHLSVSRLAEVAREPQMESFSTLVAVLSSADRHGVAYLTARDLAEDWGWARASVERDLAQLEALGLVRVERDRVEVVGFADYLVADDG